MAMKSSRHPGISIVFYDTEATGLHAKNDVITQLGAKCGSLKYNKYVVPTVPIPRSIKTLTGISIKRNQMYCHGNPVDSVSPAEAARTFLNFLESIGGRVVLIAHNCSNTHGPMLAGLMLNQGLIDRFKRVVAGFSDSLELLRRHLPRHRGSGSGYKLLDLAREYLGSSNGAHNAGKEAIMLERIIRHRSISISAKKIIDNTQSVSEIIHVYEHPPIPQRQRRRYRRNNWNRNYYEDRWDRWDYEFHGERRDDYDDDDSEESSDDDMSVDNFVDEGSGDSDEGDDEDNAVLASIVPGLNRFAQKLFEYLCLEEKNNLVISPVGISILLAMVADGAKGPSLAELESILRLPKTEETSAAGYKVLLNRLEESKEEVQCEIHVVHKIVTSDTLKIEDKFRDDMKKYFSSEILAMDWSKVDEICQAANGFCKEKTNGQISSILSPSDVPENPSLILLNAVYFKSEWVEKFPQCYTGPKTFYVTSDIEVEVSMMRVETSFAHGEIKEVHASFVVLPFKDILMKMIVFLPKELHGIKDLELYLSTVNFSELLEKSKRRDICLSLPKFRAEISTNITPTLKKMGLKEVCDMEKSDFTGVSTTSPLCIDKVIQKTFLDVNEVGVEATGVTTVRPVGGGPSGAPRLRPKEFNVNHPFVCAIIAEDNGVPIFMAKIKNPKS